MSIDIWDERVAAGYDAASAAMFEPAFVDPVVDVLAELAGDGGALELAVGTGRIAVPLARRGVRVHGVDLSPAMVARLRAKPEAKDITVTIGDIATVRVGTTFRVVFLVYNGIGNLTTQEAQVECFRTAAAHLEPGGAFVVEVMVPALQRLPPGETVHAFTVTPTELGFDEYDVVTQAAVSHHYGVTDGTFVRWSCPWRYVWPSELDLMARLAGLRLRHRWAWWNRAPFTSGSPSHVSVWEKPLEASS